MRTRLDAVGHMLARAGGVRDQLASDVASMQTELAEKQTDFKRYDAARVIGTWIADSTREEVREVFSSIGTSALQAVFGADASFDIIYHETDSGQRKAQLTSTSEGVSGDVNKKGGNSAGAVLSTMLRRAMILLDKRLEKTLFADEPLYGIDANKVSVVAELDRALVNDNGLQLIIITHDGEDDYRDLADVVIEVFKQYGVSHAHITQKIEEEL